MLSFAPYLAEYSFKGDAPTEREAELLRIAPDEGGVRLECTTFDETIRGIMGAGSLICQQIAAASPRLAKGKKGAQRVIGLASGESTRCSDLMQSS